MEGGAKTVFDKYQKYVEIFKGDATAEDIDSLLSETEDNDNKELHAAIKMFLALKENASALNTDDSNESPQTDDNKKPQTDDNKKPQTDDKKKPQTDSNEKPYDNGIEKVLNEYKQIESILSKKGPKTADEKSKLGEVKKVVEAWFASSKGNGTAQEILDMANEVKARGYWLSDEERSEYNKELNNYIELANIESKIAGSIEG